MIKKKFFLLIFLLSFSFVSADITSDCSDINVLYSFEGDAIDLSKNGNDGTVTGAILSDGIIGQGYTFDGVSDKIQISTDVKNYLNKTQGTISFWYKTSGLSSSNSPRLFSYETGGDDLFFNVWGDANLYLQYNADYNGREKISTPVPNYLTDDLWHHVVGTWDVNSNSETLTITNDGVRKTSNLTFLDPVDYSGFAKIASPFNGSIDEFIIYDIVLNESQIIELYNDGLGVQVYCGVGIGICKNGVDDDNDGFTDLSDSGCLDENDIDERFCGDSYIDNNEVCDNSNLSFKTCESLAYGFIGGDLGCNYDCKDFNLSECIEPTCNDLDNDGYGSPGIFTCPQNLTNDCDDTNHNIFQNLTGYVDSDNDGFGTGVSQSICSGNFLPSGYSNYNGDCDDNGISVNPDSTEGPYLTSACSDGLDNDCDGLIDGDDFDCSGKIPAFPGAEGFGAYSVGGRGGEIFVVTNLNDYGPGSLREGVQMPIKSYNGSIPTWETLEEYNLRVAAGNNKPRHYPNAINRYESYPDYQNRLDNYTPRIIIFNVSGIINLESSLLINHPHLTIAGQTSPGGILVTGRQVTVKSHELILRHMRFRVGSHRILEGVDPETLDSFDIWGPGWSDEIKASNIIIDHCSFSWGVDETFTISGGVQNTTVQRSIISEGLSHAGHPKGEHSKGLLVSGKYNGSQYNTTQTCIRNNCDTTVSLHHNYIVHNRDRVPQLFAVDSVGLIVDIINQVSYNWGSGFSPYSGGSAKVNWIQNYMKKGIDSNYYSFELAYTSELPIPSPLIYTFGNIGSTRMNQSEPQWNVGTAWKNILLSQEWRKNSSWDIPNFAKIKTSEMSHDYALEILSDVGANKCSRLNNCSDSVDKRVVQDFIDKTGSIIDNVIFPDDFPTFLSLAPPVDSDKDGMSDVWETNTFGDLSKSNNGDEDNDGYTNIEEYLHYLAGDVSEEPVINSCDVDNDGLNKRGSCGGTDCDDNDPSVLECHKADTSFDNCVSVTELASHLNLWMSSSSVSIRDVIGAEKVFKSCNS